MARYDKYEPKGGGFRAPIAGDRAATPGTVGDDDGPVGVGLDADGRVVDGGGNTGILGILALPRDVVEGDVVDVMTHGEIVGFGGDDGTVYYAAADGTIGTADTGTRVGHTVEGNRLVVRVNA